MWDVGMHAKKQIRNPKHEILNKSKIEMSNVPNRKHETRKEKHSATAMKITN